jgi:hypothetical protein
MATLVTDSRPSRQGREPSRAELLDQLERIVSSNHFRNSKRYPSFLRFIVERTVEENTEVLKERNLGTEVFGRPSDYDTSADPIVRVTAGEVRKRIAQYYQTAGHEHELRIELPLGSYVPHFYSVSHPIEISDRVEAEDWTSLSSSHLPGVDEEVVLPKRSLKRTSLYKRLFEAGVYILAAVGLVSTILYVGNAVRNRYKNSATNYFWQSFTPTNTSALIVIGVHNTDGTGKSIPAEARASSAQSEKGSALDAMENSDMLPVSDLVSYSKITDLLTRRSMTYKTQSSADTTLDELRTGPVVLIGGFNNLWTLRLTSTLRFRLVPKTDSVNQIQDSQHPSTVWAFDNLQPALSNSRDYAIVASYYDTTIEQHVNLAAGIGKNGTIAAAEFLTSEKDMANWLSDAKVSRNKNVELVLSTEVLDGEPGPPHVIASYTW